MKRMIRVLAMVTLMAVILVVSVTPVLARPARFGQQMPTDRLCEIAAADAQNERGAHHVFNPPGHTGCWLVLPGQGE